MDAIRFSYDIRPSVVMFDLDGTLVDTMFAFADLAAQMMHAHHGTAVASGRQRYLETSGIPFAQQLELIHPQHRANSTASAEFEKLKRAICVRTPMDAKTVEALEGLRDRGLRLVVSSNTGQEFVDEFVAREGFPFDLTLGFDETAGLAKGQPHVSATLAHFQVVPSNLWFVGDSLKDGEIAATCGITFVGRVGTFPAAAFETRFAAIRVVNHPIELLEML